jgi:hypothetical protein
MMSFIRVISIFVLSVNVCMMLFMVLCVCVCLSCVFLLGRECAVLLSGHLSFIVLECVRDSCVTGVANILKTLT